MSALPEEAISTETRRYAAFLRKPFQIRTVLAAIARAMPAPNSLIARDGQLG